jgi:hypothetical protein
MEHFFHAGASELAPTLELFIGFLIPGFDLERSRCMCLHILFLSVDLSAHLTPVAAVEIGEKDSPVFLFLDCLTAFCANSMCRMASSRLPATACARATPSSAYAQSK